MRIPADPPGELRQHRYLGRSRDGGRTPSAGPTRRGWTTCSAHCSPKTKRSSILPVLARVLPSYRGWSRRIDRHCEASCVRFNSAWPKTRDAGQSRRRRRFGTQSGRQPRSTVHAGKRVSPRGPTQRRWPLPSNIPTTSHRRRALAPCWHWCWRAGMVTRAFVIEE